MESRESKTLNDLSKIKRDSTVEENSGALKTAIREGLETVCEARRTRASSEETLIALMMAGCSAIAPLW